MRSLPDKVIAWSLESYDAFRELSRDSRSGVSMIELRNYSRAGEIEIPVMGAFVRRATSCCESRRVHERLCHRRFH